jgi:hypothetical protein
MRWFAYLIITLLIGLFLSALFTSCHIEEEKSTAPNRQMVLPDSLPNRDANADHKV